MLNDHEMFILFNALQSSSPKKNFCRGVTKLYLTCKHENHPFDIGKRIPSIFSKLKTNELLPYKANIMEVIKLKAVAPVTDTVLETGK